jgi:hypothetical protein
MVDWHFNEIINVFKLSMNLGGSPVPLGREGVPGPEGGDGQAGRNDQRKVLHRPLVAHQIHLRLH